MLRAATLIDSLPLATGETQVIAAIQSALMETGCYVGASIFSPDLTSRLATRATALASSGELQAARVGRAAGAMHVGAMRSDETRWLDAAPADAAERDALNAVEDLRLTLNRSLFLGARRAELHFARYAPGAFYRVHRDRFRDDDARCLTLIFYLNAGWQPDDGGELVLYADDNSGAILQRIEPRAGTMVCFMSERFPHEVRPARRERYSLTGWLRRDGDLFVDTVRK